MSHRPQGDIGPVSEPHVQIIVDSEPVPAALQAALQRVGARVSIRSLHKAAASGVSPSADACVIVAGEDGPGDLLEQVMADASSRACAAMVLPRTTAAERESLPPNPDRTRRRLAKPSAENADTLTADEITGRIRAMCELRRPLVCMREEVERLRSEDSHARCGRETASHDAHAHATAEEQLRLAGQVQTDLLPTPLDDTAPLDISTLYLPAETLSGDIYDIARLDEQRISFSIADATGHGLPAALLTFLIRQSFRGKEIAGNTYRIIEPGELLGRLNDDLLHASLSCCQFVTALHAVYDRGTSQVRFARGGCPYPILVRAGRPAELLKSEGGLIGAFAQDFQTVEYTLDPGDTLVLHTDGVNALLMERGPDGPASILQTGWMRQLEADGPAAALQSLRELAQQTPASDWPADDITAIALRVGA